MTLTIGSLFSGMGGLEKGLEMSGLGPVIWQVEKDESCRKVLAKHWPNAKRYEDVCEVGREQLAAVDVVCAGFPCQDVSSAGTGKGLAGERSGLWGQCARILGEVQPAWVVVENVTSGGSRWFDPVVRDLEQLGYAVLPIPLSAFDVGAPHRRARMFLVARSTERRARADTGTDARRRPANIDDQRELQPEGHGIVGERAGHDSWWRTEPDVVRVVYGVPRRLDRLKQLGNSVVPQCAEVVGYVIQELAG